MKVEPGTTSTETIARYRAHVSEGMAMLAELMDAHVEARSDGTRIWDEEGTEYLDCGGYGVFLLGHRYPRVVAAVHEQLDRHPMSSRVLLNGDLARAAEQLARVAPEGLDYVFFTNSGAEATELAIKLARVNGRRRLISTNGGFHGKTYGALSVTGKAMFRDPFVPGLADVSFVDFDDLDALDAELAAGEPAAVILEPIQAEGGVIIPADGYLQAVRELCDRHGALFVLDEVQTGLGRLGSWWGADREGVVPDVLLVGKGLSGGVVPVAGIVATADVYRPISEDPLLHSSTYAGNPLAMAAASAAITALEEDDIIPRAESLGARLLDELLALKRDHAPNVLADVRGRGLLIAFEFEEDHLAGDFVLELLNRQVIVSTSLNANRVVRLHPAAIMDEEDIEWALSALRESADAVEARFGGTDNGEEGGSSA
jgi:putrescine aminotransferase